MAQFPASVGVNSCDEVMASTRLARNEISAYPQGNDGPSQTFLCPQPSSYDVDTIIGIPSNVTAPADGEDVSSGK